ncbi:Antiviral protein CAP [Leucoagaricus sp. SymC.cos]|nr:Antiviral protein CAP [Leucoagaricus sp. SymC.cos]
MLNLIALVACAAVVLARIPPDLTCYQTGTGPASMCEPFICDFCKGVAQIKLNVGESSGACYNLYTGHKCDFTAFNTGNTTATPSEEACNAALWTTTASCNLGGFGKMVWTPGPYTFGVDPEFGSCSLTGRGC